MADALTLTHRRVLAIALPIVLSNATVPILGVVDTAVVGQLGEARGEARHHSKVDKREASRDRGPG